MAKEPDRILGILGCGLQGRKHLEAIHAARPRFDWCVCYDLVPERQMHFITEMSGQFGFDSIVGTSGPEEVARNCDVLVTGGPIQKDREPVIRASWLGAGMLVVTIDYGSYVTDEAIRSMDLILTDFEQIEDARSNEGKFPGVTRVDSTAAELVAHGKGARTSDEQRILVFNLGIALEDLAAAIEILNRAEGAEIGRGCPPGRNRIRRRASMPSPLDGGAVHGCPRRGPAGFRGPGRRRPARRADRGWP